MNHSLMEKKPGHTVVPLDHCNWGHVVVVPLDHCNWGHVVYFGFSFLSF